MQWQLTRPDECVVEVVPVLCHQPLTADLRVRALEVGAEQRVPSEMEILERPAKEPELARFVGERSVSSLAESTQHIQLKRRQRFVTHLKQAIKRRPRRSRPSQKLEGLPEAGCAQRRH